jgi:hypothetical protein
MTCCFFVLVELPKSQTKHAICTVDLHLEVRPRPLIFRVLVIGYEIDKTLDHVLEA